MKGIAIATLTFCIMTLLAMSASSEGWTGLDCPFVHHFGNSSYLYVSNVMYTEGWNIEYQDGKMVPIEAKILDPTWVTGINLTTGEATLLVPVERFGLNETYFFRNNGQPYLDAFNITDANDATVFETGFSVSGVTGPIDKSYTFVDNGAEILYGHWVIYQQNGCAAVISNNEVSIIGEYLVRGEPTGYASEGSDRPLEMAKLKTDIEKIHARISTIS